MTRTGARPPRLAELVASLSVATDLGLGLPEDHVMRQTMIARRLGTAAGFTPEQHATAFYVSLLAWVGCISDSHELARSFGDDLRVRRESYQVDKAGAEMMRFLLAQVMTGRTTAQGIAMVGRVLAGGFSDAVDSFITHCQTTGDIADRLALPPGVRRCLTQVFERWDGRGSPGELSGAEIDPVVRVVQIADDAEVLCRTAGVDAAVDMLTSRRGTEFDPDLVNLIVAQADSIFDNLEYCDAWAAVITADPGAGPPMSGRELDAALVVFADYADLKSPYFLGHSRAAAALARDAATCLGLPPDDIALVHNAALVAHLGRTGVSTGIWNKTSPLTAAEWERVRQVPYLTERILRRQPALDELGAIAGKVHEHLDGSGYPRGLTAVSLPMPARILAVADWYQALGEARPHRAALDHAARAELLRQRVAAGEFDDAAARAVLTAAGQRIPRRTMLVAGLTERELQVLEALVRGRSNREIAEDLHISRKTVGSHVEHIYAKIGVSTRGAAAMFAMRHGLVGAGE